MWPKGRLQGLTWPRMAGGWPNDGSRELQDGFRMASRGHEIAPWRWQLFCCNGWPLGLPPWLPSQAPESLNMSPKWPKLALKWTYSGLRCLNGGSNDWHAKKDGA